ncbi:MAG: hypothetical protein ABL962_01660 [Fimbriimonadaceae bacterium]
MRAFARSGLLLALAIPTMAQAYYDDVHYGLTYYIARQTGFTPPQAYRIASACSAVDWDERTEPVRLGRQLTALLTPLEIELHGPRNKFHAFRDESNPARRVLGNEPDAAAAQQEIYDRLAELKKFSTEVSKNLGVYLHGFQDVYPHFGWGTYWGHNPADYTVFDRAVKQGMHPGSSTDWVDFRQSHVLNLCAWTNAELIPFMNAISPHQYARPYYQHEFYELIVRLAEANRYPPPLDTDLDRLTFLYVGLRENGAPAETILKAMNGQEKIDKVIAYLKDPAIEQKMDKHLKGPDMKKAYPVIDSFLEKSGMADRLPAHHIPYRLSNQGGPTDPAQLNDWVLVSDATTLETTGYRSVTVTLKMDVRDAEGKVKRTDLFKAATPEIRAGGSYTWANLPIGDIYAHMKPANGNELVSRLEVRKRKQTFRADVGGTPPPKPTRLPVPTKPKTKPPADPPPTTSVDFTGHWHSMVGRIGYKHDLTMSQSGNEVTGSWIHASGSGTLKGTVKGSTLTFTWEAGGDKGTGEFRMRTGKTEFTGSYSSDAKDGVKGNPWSGHKLPQFGSNLFRM